MLWTAARSFSACRFGVLCVVMVVLVLVAVAFAYPTSAPCPIDGQGAPYTGHYREVSHSDGKHILCEYADDVAPDRRRADKPPSQRVAPIWPPWRNCALASFPQ